jgi:hypothetical protein
MAEIIWIFTKSQPHIRTPGKFLKSKGALLPMKRNMYFG